MALYRAQIGFAMDSALPRDIVTINPHFAGDAPQALADALKTNLIAQSTIGAGKRFVVKIYDALKSPPSYPLATAESSTGFWASGFPREVALCLSYYAAFNRKYTRGRLYIPATLIGGSLGLRPTAGQITTALDFRKVFTDNLPPGHVWNQYSPTLKHSEPVTDVWVDDEWDTVRSRGLRGTVRQTIHLANPLP
jgi:hypothetical protein